MESGVERAAGTRSLRPGDRRRDAPARQHRDGRLRQARGGQARSRRADVRRPRAARGRARHGEDGARPRDRRQHRRGDDLADPVHARPPADRRHGHVRLRPEDARLRVPSRADLHERPARRRDQPRDAEDAVGAARGDGRGPGDRGRGDDAAPEPVLPARDGQPDRVRRHLPAAGGAARPLPPADRARLSRRASRSGASSRSSATATRSRTCSRSSALEDVQELREAAQHVYVDEVLHNWIVDLVRSTRELEVVSIGSSVRGSLAVERVARAWALLNGRGYVVPEDVERLFVPVLVHRVVFTPALVARARAAGWPAAIEEFRLACLELAPRPGSDEDPLFHERPSRPARQPKLERRQPDLPARLPPPPDRADPRHDAERSPRPRLRGRRLASVPPRRRHPLDRLGRLGAPLLRARPGRVRRPRALRGRGAARRRRRRPPARARLPQAAAAVARQGRGDADDARDRALERRSRGRLRRLHRRTRTASRTGCRRAASAGSRTSARSASTRPGGARRRTASSARSSTSSSTAARSPPGSFVFVLSDFLDAPSRETWLTAVEHLWDVVPVVIQDPTWEQSFPDVSGIVVPLRDRAHRARDARPADEEGGGRAEARSTRSGCWRCSTSSPCSISTPS